MLKPNWGDTPEEQCHCWYLRLKFSPTLPHPCLPPTWRWSSGWLTRHGASGVLDQMVTVGSPPASAVSLRAILWLSFSSPWLRLLRLQPGLAATCDCDLCCLPLLSSRPFPADRRPAIIPVLAALGIGDDWIQSNFTQLIFKALARADIRRGRRTAPCGILSVTLYGWSAPTGRVSDVR